MNDNTQSNSLKIEVFGLTDVGCVRSSNEDCFIIQPMCQQDITLNGQGLFHELQSADMFVAVSDGMGGAAAGEVASSTGLRTLSEHLMSVADQLAEFDPEKIVTTVEHGIQEANKAIFSAAQANKAQKGMGATITALYLRRDIAYLFQIGDSRAYLMRGDVFRKITRDQSFVGHLVEMGTITEEQAARHPQRNVILQALGTGDRLKVDISFIPLCQGDCLLVCTDGLYSEFSATDLERRVKTISRDEPKMSAQIHHLIDEAKKAGGHDNITLVGIRCGEGFPAREPGEDPRFIPFPFLDDDNPTGRMFQVQG